MKQKLFVAYPASPEQLGQTIELAKEKAPEEKPSLEIVTWKRPDIAGFELIQPILEAIQQADVVAADVTFPNFNVAYEVGYALGLGKRVIPLVNTAFEFDAQTYQRIGVFDTLLREPYNNAERLLDIFASAAAGQRIATAYPPGAYPLYVVLPATKIDEYASLRARAKRAGLLADGFDPSEHGTLSATDAVKGVAASYGVIAPLLAPNMSDAHGHNLRAAFVAGVAHALAKPTLLLKKGDWPAAADVRDQVATFNSEASLQSELSEFAGRVHDNIYAAPPRKGTKPKSGLATLDLGNPAAEFEELGLEEYFLDRDEFRQVIDGRANIVIGRKGSGKTAVWVKARDDLKEDRSRIVLALNPEGYQLKKLKDIVLQFLVAGSKDFLLSAFWEYVLMLEICAGILQKDKELHKRNHKLYEPYQKLLAYFKRDPATSGLDFSDRLAKLVDRLGERYESNFGQRKNNTLSGNELANILYCTTLSELRSEIEDYLSNKSGVWILFDNIDKGWHASGLQNADVAMIRTLIDAGKKLRNDFGRKGTTFQFTSFIRNDVYENLLRATPDRGKDNTAVVDWRDRDLLKQIIRKRIIANVGFKPDSMSMLWHQICVPIVYDQSSLDYLVDRCLMRPRYLLRVIGHCLASATNFQKERIDEDDIDKGVSLYSSEIVTEIDLEIRDIVGLTSDVLYIFIGEKRTMRRSEVFALLRGHLGEKDLDDAIFKLFLWHGVLGLCRLGGEVAFIFDVNYDLRRLEVLIDKTEDDDPRLQINPAFWAGLEMRA